MKEIDVNELDFLEESIENEAGSYHFEQILKNSEADKTLKLIDLNDSHGNYLASLVWCALDSYGKVINQLAVVSPDVRYISFDGKMNFLDSSAPIYNPRNSSLLTMVPGQFLFFANENTRSPDPRFGLDFNNKSLRLNNVSIWDQKYERGVMFDLRASMEGMFNKEGLNGYIVIMSTIDTIN